MIDYNCWQMQASHVKKLLHLGQILMRRSVLVTLCSNRSAQNRYIKNIRIFNGTQLFYHACQQVVLLLYIDCNMKSHFIYLVL